MNPRTEVHALQFGKVASLALLAGALVASGALAAPTCPVSMGITDNAKSNKLYLYFPTVDDSTFPSLGASAATSPARVFDVAELDPSIGTTAQLRDRITDIVADVFCEFNVQVLQTTSNPTSLTAPPARRVTVAIGSDPAGVWGLSRVTDTGNASDVDFSRVFAGLYLTCEGGDGNGGCSPPGQLRGVTSTLDRWARAIGGTAAHEAGHTYGLRHADENPDSGNCMELGGPPKPGEDAFSRHIMPTGCNLTGSDRTSPGRHMSDTGYGLLASNVGLSIQTMHNWDLTNPNAQKAASLVIDFLSAQQQISIWWSYNRPDSPWINPTVSGPSGTANFKGVALNRYRITWSTGNPAWSGGPPGSLPGGGNFHIGVVFTGVDFNAPDPIIIQNVTLFDANGNPLVLHPRLPGYDGGTPDSADGTFGVNFAAAAASGGGGFGAGGSGAGGSGAGGSQADAPLILERVEVFLLPRVASIESMAGVGRPITFEGVPIKPWKRVHCGKTSIGEKGARCVVAKLADKPNVQHASKLGDPNVIDCSKVGAAVSPGDSKLPGPDTPICAGSARDPFPSTTIYLIATVVDPDAKHYDRKQKKYVKGPVRTKIYYQFAGIRDLAKYLRATPQ